MPYVPGHSLQERIDQTGPLELREILRIGMQTAAGLAAAHAQGLVHRDIKPANILLENGVERVRITDFGLARAVDDATQTQSGVVAGTPQYMAPEQARGEAVDHRADLFSLGSVLYAMCTGHSPFRARPPWRCCGASATDARDRCDRSTPTSPTGWPRSSTSCSPNRRATAFNLPTKSPACSPNSSRNSNSQSAPTSGCRDSSSPPSLPPSLRSLYCWRLASNSGFPLTAYRVTQRPTLLLRWPAVPHQLHRAQPVVEPDTVDHELQQTEQQLRYLEASVRAPTRSSALPDRTRFEIQQLLNSLENNLASP